MARSKRTEAVGSGSGAQEYALVQLGLLAFAPAGGVLAWLVLWGGTPFRLVPLLGLALLVVAVVLAGRAVLRAYRADAKAHEDGGIPRVVGVRLVLLSLACTVAGLAATVLPLS